MVLTQWNPGFIASGSGSSAVDPRFHWVRQQTELHDELTLTGHTELVVLM
jgi:hypothetical protein